jgi:uncharacterized protein YecE (DUF72 family)
VKNNIRVTDIPIADETPGLFDVVHEMAAQQLIERPFSAPDLRIGTSAFTAAGWPGSFYPAGMKPAEYLSYYATQFNSVEVDSTFYRTPSRSTVSGWYGKTPPDFIFAAKVPQIITHEKVLLSCEREFEEFIDTMRLLDDKLGPLLLQFPYFKETDFAAGDFLTRLRSFLKRLKGTAIRYAIEIRNKAWLDQKFADILREYNIAFVLQDQGWMPRPHQLKFDYITADFAYVRLLGDRKGIEKQTKAWDKVIVDRSRELRSWVDTCQQIVKRGAPTFVYINNHYAGHAPATVAEFLRLWGAK